MPVRTYSRPHNEPLTVKDLMAILAKVRNKNSVLSMSCDTEGNAFGPVAWVEVEPGKVTLVPGDMEIPE